MRLVVLVLLLLVVLGAEMMILRRVRGWVRPGGAFLYLTTNSLKE